MEKQSLNWSVVIPWLLSLATIAIGIWQFGIQQGQANRRPFLEKQLELGFQATEAAATLASETDPAQWEQARTKFWRLYWGPMSIVEDPRVERAMVSVGSKIPREPAHTFQLPVKELQGPSYELAHAVRELVLTSWKVQLPSLQSERTR